MFVPKCVQNVRLGGLGFPVYLPELVKRQKKTKTGNVTEVAIELVNQAKELPDPITTDLETQLNAGVPLDVVKGAMFGSNTVSDSVFPSLTNKGEEDEQTNSQNSQQTNSQNSQQTNSQNSQQTNTNKGE